MTRSTPLVSIITPVLNRQETIGHSLASVATQSYPRIEHIVVDGGSTDGTLDVVRSFEGSYPLRWMSGSDEGMYEAINKGLSAARGDVLAYVNSDDLYFPWSVEAAVEALQGRADLVYGDLAILVPKRSGGKCHIQFYRDFDRKFFTYSGALGQPTVFWTRDMTDRIGPFDTSYRLIGDCEYWLRAARSGMRLGHIDEVLAVQVEHRGTLRRTHPEVLDQEWARLRDFNADWAGPAPAAWRERLRVGMGWRVKQIRLLASARMHHPKGWPRFLTWARDQGLDLRARELFWLPLPGSLRRRSSSLIDARSLQRALYAHGGKHASPGNL